MNRRTIAALALAILAVGAPLFAATASKKEVLPFIQDDYAKAIATAKAKNLPVFAEAWAPW